MIAISTNTKSILTISLLIRIINKENSLCAGCHKNYVADKMQCNKYLL